MRTACINEILVFSLVNLPLSIGVLAKTSEDKKKIIFPPLQVQDWHWGKPPGGVAGAVEWGMVAVGGALPEPL